MGSRWRRLSAGEQALLVLVHQNQGETYTALAGGFGVGTATVFRDVREGVDVLAAMAPTMQEALAVARWKAFVISTAPCYRSTGSGWSRAMTALSIQASTSATGSTC